MSGADLADRVARIESFIDRLLAAQSHGPRSSDWEALADLWFYPAAEPVDPPPAAEFNGGVLDLHSARTDAAIAAEFLDLAAEAAELFAAACHRHLGVGGDFSALDVEDQAAWITIARSARANIRKGDGGGR